MSLPKTDWDKEIRKFLNSNYEPIDSLINDQKGITEKFTLTEFYRKVTSIFPKTYIYESDVYEALEELGFKTFSYNIPAKFDEEGHEVFPEQTEYAYFMNKKTAAI